MDMSPALSLSVQNEGSTFIIPDSSVCKRTGNFRRIMKKFLNLSDFDTTHISPNRYNYVSMLDHFINYEYYSVGGVAPEPQRLRFLPKLHSKVGVYFGQRWIFLGWTIDTDDPYGKRSGKKRGTGFDFSLCSSKLGVGIIYCRTGNSYRIYDVTGFSDRIPTDYSEGFDELKVKMKGLNLYYILSNRRLSYPVAFSQSTNQRYNVGPSIAGFSVSAHNLDFDYTKLPDVVREAMNLGMKVDHMKYTNISLNSGYAYNWAFARSYLACLSLNPAVVYKTSRIDKMEGEKNDWYRNFNIDFILRVDVVYNDSKYFVGTSFVGRTYDYYRDNFSLNNGLRVL